MPDGNQLPATRPQAREVRVVEDHGAAAYLFDTARFEHMQRIATAMATASLIPDHLKGKGQDAQAHAQTVGNCFLVVNQSVRWQMDPFAVAPETYAIGGKLAYQGKLIAAVVNSRAGLKKRLEYSFEGKGDELTVTVAGTFRDEDAPRTITLRVKDAKTQNKMWSADPEQKLIYSGVTKWARRHCPEIILGVLTDDDLERIAAERAVDVTPPRPTRAQFTSPMQPAADDARADSFALITGDGEERTFVLPADARDAFMSEIEAASTEAAVDGLWETNVPLVQALRDAGENAMADELGDFSGKRLDEIRAASRAHNASEVSDQGEPTKDAEPDPFWQTDLVLAPEKKGNSGSFYWPAWEDKVRARIAEAPSQMLLAEFQLANKAWLDRHKLARAEQAAEIAEAFKARAAELAGGGE